MKVLNRNKKMVLYFTFFQLTKIKISRWLQIKAKNLLKPFSTYNKKEGGIV